MSSNRYVMLRKEDFNDFISRLAKLRKLVAPIARGYNNFAFAEVTAGYEVAVNYIPTILPPKKYLLPQRETLLKFKIGEGLESTPVVEHEITTIFGVHTCDIAGIQCLNMVFSTRPRDFNYLTRKRETTIIGLECNDYCDASASCTLVNANLPHGGYDLLFTDMGEYFMVHVSTQAGEEIIEAAKLFATATAEQLQALESLRARKRKIFKNEVPIDPGTIPALFDKSFASQVWEELGERCLACGNCTNVCPTCYCFDVKDEMNLNLKSGKRYRVWDSCQGEPFASVVGNHNFRKERADRQKHRYYRKFRYPVDKYHRFFCTGCGRCSRTCMAGIRLKETLNALTKEQAK